MKEIEADLIFDDDNGNELDDPYFKLIDGRRILMEDAIGADWKDHDGQIKAAFTVARAGTGDLVYLELGDDIVWLTTEDKINS